MGILRRQQALIGVRACVALAVLLLTFSHGYHFGQLNVANQGCPLCPLRAAVGTTVPPAVRATVGTAVPPALRATGSQARIKMSVPLWALDKTSVGSLGQAFQGGGAHMITAEKIRTSSKSQSGEELLAYKRYFYGLTGGVYLEMGALNGVLFSNTRALEEHAGWRGLLIEASPDSYRRLEHNRPGSITVNAAICVNPAP